MTFNEKVELVRHMALWTKTVVLGLGWHYLCKEVITQPNRFTDRTAEHVHLRFIFFDRTDWQSRDIGRLIAYHRPALAQKLGIQALEYSALTKMIHNMEVSDQRVRQELLLFMAQDRTLIDSPDLLRMIRVHRPDLGAEFDRSLIPQ